MGKTGGFGFFVGQVFKASGTKAAMIKEAEKVKLGHAAVWKLTADGKRIGTKPVARWSNGTRTI